MLRGMPIPTKLASAAASKPPAASPPPPLNHRFEQALQSGRVSIPYIIPGIELSCLMFVVGSDKQLELEGKANELMAHRGFVLTDENADKFELCKAWHILAHACRDDACELQPNPPPIGTPEHWGQLPPAVVAAVWLRFLDLCTQHDPLADNVKLTESEFIGIRDSLKKKDGRALRFYGLPKLIVYMLITESLQSISPTLKSEGGDSSPESSSGMPSTAGAEQPS
jgi:hypothetical protein